MAKSKSNLKKSVKTVNDVFNDVLSNDWLAILLLLLFWLVFFRDLLTGKAFLADDFIEQYFPGKTFATVSLSKGVIPFWNPYTFSGMPFLADIQVAVFYPFNVLMTLFVSGERLPAVVLQISIILHYLLNSIFCFYIGKHFRFTNTVSVIFALMFTYSSYMIIHMIHMPLVEAVIWLPLVFLLWLKFIDSKKYIYVFVAGLVMVVCTLAGYPQVTFYNYVFISLYLLVLGIKSLGERDFVFIRHLISAYIIFLLFSFGISAFQLLPTNEFVSNSNRAKITYEFATEGSIHPNDLITVFTPKIFGVWKFNRGSSDLEWYATHHKGSFMFSIANLYISALFVVMIVPVLIFLFRKRIKTSLIYLLLAIGVVTVLFSLGGNFFVHRLFYDYIPFFGRFRNPGHSLYLYTFSFSLIIAFGLDGLFKNRNEFSKIFNRTYFFALIGVVAILLFIGVSGSFVPTGISSADIIRSWISKQFLLFTILSLLFAGLVYFFAAGKLTYKLFNISLVLLLCFELYYIWYEQNNGSLNPEAVYQQRRQKIDEFKNELKSELFRINMREGRNIYFQRNQGMIDRIPLIEGYGALILDKYIPINKANSNSTQTHDIMNIKYKIDPVKMSFYLNSSYLPRVKMFYDAKIFNTADSVALRNYMQSESFDYRKTLVVETENNETFQLPQVVDSTKLPSNDIRIISYSENEIKVQVKTDENGFLFFSEVFYPAWKAYVDGGLRPIYRADYCERAVYLEKGTHIVEMKYESDTFKQGLLLSLNLLWINLLGIIILSVKPLWKKKKESDQDFS
ncbi:MAG: YfhO family protein [Ignavibacteria bacterium]